MIVEPGIRIRIILWSMLNLSILFTLLITPVQPVVLFVKLEKHYGVILENITSSSTEIII